MNYGYIYNLPEIERIAAQQPPLRMSSGGGKGKNVFLWEIERSLTGNVRPPHDQKIGDCTSHALCGAAEDLQFIQMAKDPSLVFESLSTEVIYGLARHQIGKDACGSLEGAVVAWVIQAALDYGLLARASYDGYDLSNYDFRLATLFGAQGPPEYLVSESHKHPILQAYLLRGPDFFAEARDVIANLGVIVTGSNQLYKQERDAQGFSIPDTFGGHSTYYRGVTDNPKRPGIAYQQSWGELPPPVSIILPDGGVCNLPAGCYFIDAEDFNKMHVSGEVWAISSETGFQKPETPYSFYTP